MLGTIKFVNSSVNDNSTRRLDHCNIIALCRYDVPHSKVELQTEFKSLTAAHLGSNINQHVEWTARSTFIISSMSVYAPHLVQSVLLHLFKHRGADNAHWISKDKMAAAAVEWELTARISVKISRIWEFRVIMGIMIGLLECCSSNTVGAGRMITSNPCYARVLTESFGMLHRVLDEQHPRSPVIIS